MNKKVYKIFVIFLASIASFLSIMHFLPSSSESDSIYDSVFRLHIIANSDSEADQKVKLLVRDALLNYERQAMEKADSREEAKELLMQSGDEILKLTEKVLKENGFNYKAQLMIGNFYFPDREYQDKFYPAGNYEALRIILGDGNGKNWWCVMFPPLCILDTDNGQIEQEEIKFSSFFLDILNRIDGGVLWSSIKEKFASCLQ
ncbi:MAG: stage II sporulation protein R [Clostridia bacterium]|nr:stage II sporulation protein R [Clostridia bacterium]